METSIILLIVGIFAGANLHMPSWIKPKPDTTALVAAQQAAADAKQREIRATAELETIKAQQQDATDSQLLYTHEMNEGVRESLRQAPASPQVELAKGFAERVDAGLRAARGTGLTPAQMAEVDKIVVSALSAAKEERDRAFAMLAQKDADLKVAVEQKQALAVEAAQAQIEVKVAKAEAQVAETKVQTKTAEVVEWVKKKELGDSISDAMQARVFLWGGIAIGLFILIQFVLPSFAQDHPDSKVIQWVYKKVATLTSGHKIDFGNPPTA